jgi:hypothetical protein
VPVETCCSESQRPKLKATITSPASATREPGLFFERQFPISRSQFVAFPQAFKDFSGRTNRIIDATGPSDFSVHCWATRINYINRRLIDFDRSKPIFLEIL